jgi:hypothetical protein
VNVRPDAGPNEDVNHPIPSLDTLDTLVESAQGARVGIVIASPLLDDPISRARLQRKIELALGYFGGAAFRQKHGVPNPVHCKIYIGVHARSAPAMLNLVKYYCSQFAANGVAPVVRLIEADG